MALPCSSLGSSYQLPNYSTLQFSYEAPSEEYAQSSSYFPATSHYMEDLSSYSSDSQSSVETDPSSIFNVENVFDPASVNHSLSMMTLTNLNTNEQSIDCFSAELTDISGYNQNTAFSTQPSPQQSLWSSSESISSSIPIQDLLFIDDNLGIDSPADLEFSDDDDFNGETAHKLNDIIPTFEPVLTKQEQREACTAWDQVPSPPPPSHNNNNNNTSIQVQRRRSTKQPILYLVLFHALEHPEDYQDLIYWIDKSKGIFEFSSRNKEWFARAWGIVKNNRCKMTYQKMSRALRIYIKKKIVLTKMKRKLQYVFLPEVLIKLYQRQLAGDIVSSDIAEIMLKESRQQIN